MKFSNNETRNKAVIHYYQKKFYDWRDVYNHFRDQIVMSTADMGIKWEEVEPYLKWQGFEPGALLEPYCLSDGENRHVICASYRTIRGVTIPVISITTKDNSYVFNGWMELSGRMNWQWRLMPDGNWQTYLSILGGCRLPRGMQRKARKGGRHG